MSETQSKPAPIPETFLHTKLMPPRSNANLVPRSALLARLDEALEKKLALFTAPTGFGKTTLVSMWLTGRVEPSGTRQNKRAV